MGSDSSPDVGAKAPVFTLQGTQGRTVALKDYLGRQNLVLYFYPKDNTPGCTLEACDFRDTHGKFASSRTVVLGISGDTVESHERFATRHELPFPLLSDPGASVARAYGAWGKKSFMGREFFGIHRTTFVIDTRGTIRRVYPRVRVKDHAADVLKFVRDELA